MPQVKMYAYLNYLIVISPTFDQQNLEIVFAQLGKANLQVNQSKCRFVRQKFKYLGRIVTLDGVLTDPEKVSAMLHLP